MVGFRRFHDIGNYISMYQFVYMVQIFEEYKFLHKDVSLLFH